MDQPRSRPTAANQNRMRERRSTLRTRPDRIALWAVGIAVLALLAAAVSADANTTGGIAPDGGGGASTQEGEETQVSECDSSLRFGSRPLTRGDCGDDVRTLNWILRSKGFAAPALKLGGRFGGPTTKTVRRFQRRQRLRTDGALRKQTRSRLIASMRRERATWYGPGFFGNRTACGQRLRRKTRGVAHRTLPCGTRVVLRNRGRTVRTRVIDRGPFAHGARWDLTQRVARELRFDGVGRIRAATVR